MHRRETKYSRMVLRRQREIMTARCPVVVAAKEGERSHKSTDSPAPKKNQVILCTHDQAELDLPQLASRENTPEV